MSTIEESPEIRPLGGAARWWLHQSLESLAARLRAAGQVLVLRRGPAEKVVPEVARASGAAAVYWNRRYGAAAALDERVAASMPNTGIVTAAFDGHLLFAPRRHPNRLRQRIQGLHGFLAGARTGGRAPAPPARPDGHPGRRSRQERRPRKPGPHSRGSTTGRPVSAMRGSRESRPRRRRWPPSSARIDRYAAERDRPAANATSRLSPYLRFGEISPSQVWHAIAGTPAGAARAKFLSELGWREFAWHLLDDRPDLATTNLKPAFDDFPWAETYADDIWAWRRGRTGYPIVDAGMRQLWATGWMHNRARMIAASFLVKHLLADWRIGEEWFWDTLVDAEPASNPVNWQWVAGSGADAQPFFRIFNPVLQGEKFDPDGAYVRRWVPELGRLPDRFIHKPWAAPEDVLATAGVRLGDTYPRPIIDHDEARQRALDAFATLKQRDRAGKVARSAGGKPRPAAIRRP